MIQVLLKLNIFLSDTKPEKLNGFSKIFEKLGVYF